jgi:hypothetical protein
MLHVFTALKSVAVSETEIGDLFENGVNARHSGYILALYLGGPGFKSRPGDQLFLLKMLRVSCLFR